jgi:hypothetical protein
VWVARKPPGFAFIDFDDKRDAEDALRDIDGNTPIFLGSACLNLGQHITLRFYLIYNKCMVSKTCRAGFQW